MLILHISIYAEHDSGAGDEIVLLNKVVAISLICFFKNLGVTCPLSNVEDQRSIKSLVASLPLFFIRVSSQNVENGSRQPADTIGGARKITGMRFEINSCPLFVESSDLSLSLDNAIEI